MKKTNKKILTTLSVTAIAMATTAGAVAQSCGPQGTVDETIILEGESPIITTYISPSGQDRQVTLQTRFIQDAFSYPTVGGILRTESEYQAWTIIGSDTGPGYSLNFINFSEDGLTENYQLDFDNLNFNFEYGLIIEPEIRWDVNSPVPLPIFNIQYNRQTQAVTVAQRTEVPAVFEVAQRDTILDFLNGTGNFSVDGTGVLNVTTQANTVLPTGAFTTNVQNNFQVTSFLTSSFLAATSSAVDISTITNFLFGTAFTINGASDNNVVHNVTSGLLTVSSLSLAFTTDSQTPTAAITQAITNDVTLFGYTNTFNANTLVVFPFSLSN